MCGFTTATNLQLGLNQFLHHGCLVGHWGKPWEPGTLGDPTQTQHPCQLEIPPQPIIEGWFFSDAFFFHMWINVDMQMRVDKNMCVYVYIYMYLYIYICIYIYVCICILGFTNH